LAVSELAATALH